MARHKPTTAKLREILDELSGNDDVPVNLPPWEAKLFTTIDPDEIDDNPHSYTTCHTTGKVRYPSRKRAKEMVHLRQKRGAGRLRIYICPDCKSFHLTSNPT